MMKQLATGFATGDRLRHPCAWRFPGAARHGAADRRRPQMDRRMHRRQQGRRPDAEGGRSLLHLHEQPDEQQRAPFDHAMGKSQSQRAGTLQQAGRLGPLIFRHSPSRDPTFHPRSTMCFGDFLSPVAEGDALAAHAGGLGHRAAIAREVPAQGFQHSPE